jgi:hypothetical protein
LPPSPPIAAVVPDIGFLLTVFSSYNAPYNLARRLASLDQISGGRVIWNIVSSFNPDIAANFGAAPLPPRADRYRRADEFVEVVKKLWLSWDTPKGDAPVERLWDGATARSIDHHGEFFDVAGPLNVPVGPQGHPVIAQAGASDAGIDLAAKHADIVYASLLHKQAAFQYKAQLGERAAAHGRDRDGPAHCRALHRYRRGHGPCVRPLPPAGLPFRSLYQGPEGPQALHSRKPAVYPVLGPLIGGGIETAAITSQWTELMRLKASIEAGTVVPSVILRKLSAAGAGNALSRALRAVGRIERTLFTLQWLSEPDLRQRSHSGLNKGEASNALPARGVLPPPGRNSRPHFREPGLSRVRPQPHHRCDRPLEHGLPAPCLTARPCSRRNDTG